MAKDKVEVHGVEELFRGTDKLVGRIVDITPEAFEKIANLAVAQVRVKMPSKTGRMRDSVRAARQKKRVLVRAGKAKVPYMGWMEFGGTRGRPYIGQGRYLYPTAFDMEPQLVKIANEVAHEQIERQRWEETA